MPPQDEAKKSEIERLEELISKHRLDQQLSKKHKKVIDKVKKEYGPQIIDIINDMNNDDE